MFLILLYGEKLYDYCHGLRDLQSNRDGFRTLKSVGSSCQVRAWTEELGKYGLLQEK